MDLKVGMPAPDFTLPLATFGTVALSNMRGKPVVLYFYPKDDTPGCTTEACDFRDALPRFGDFDAAVIGISKDTVESHAAFARKHGLNFHLASDANARTCEDYGVWVQKNLYGQVSMGIERTTVLIDRHGIIRHIWRRVSVAGHVDEVRQLVEALHHGQPLPGDRRPEPAAAPTPPPQTAPAASATPPRTAAVRPVVPSAPAAPPPATKAGQGAVKTVVKKAAEKKDSKSTVAAARKPAAPSKKPAVKKPTATKAKKPAPQKPAPKKTAVKKPAKPVKKATPTATRKAVPARKPAHGTSGMKKKPGTAPSKTKKTPVRKPPAKKKAVPPKRR